MRFRNDRLNNTTRETDLNTKPPPTTHVTGDLFYENSLHTTEFVMFILISKCIDNLKAIQMRCKHAEPTMHESVHIICIR